MTSSVVVILAVGIFLIAGLLGSQYDKNLDDDERWDNKANDCKPVGSVGKNEENRQQHQHGKNQDGQYFVIHKVEMIDCKCQREGEYFSKQG